MLLALLLWYATVVGTLEGTNCPHEDPSLKPFSRTYESLTKHSNIVVTEGVLLDVAELDVNTIEVKGEGRLVFNQGHDITVKTKGIFVADNGELIIGSDDCRHENNVHIQLEGERTVNRTTLGPEGEKYIAVTDNGSLHIHGQDRLAWTKLSGTVDRFDANPDNVIYRHMATDELNGRATQKGLAVHIIDSDLEGAQYVNCMLPKNKASKADRNLRRAADTLFEATDGRVVSIAIKNGFVKADGVDFDAFFGYIESLAGMNEGELLLRKAEPYDSFSLIFVVGGGSFDQVLDQHVGKRITEARSAVVYNGKTITSVSRVLPEKNTQSFADLRIVNTTVYPEITVTHDIGSWQTGDLVLFTSTDYAWDHGEVRTIKEITGQYTFTLTHEFDYRHFGEIEDGVDMRAEVALLSRNIKISGVMANDCPAQNGNCYAKTEFLDTYGGHVKIFDNFKEVVIQGAELEFMGQTMDKGFYPIHFHMCKNITGKTAIIKHNSIHDTYARATTVHGTFGTTMESPGVQLIGNVAFNIFGHAYFLEDGAEMATLLIGNLAAAVQTVDNDFATDRRRPTGFWITNPKTLLIGNVAAGSQGFGIWYTFPQAPVGPSTGLVYQFKEAKYTPLWTFDNNVVHSNELGGLNFDFILSDDSGHVQGCMQYKSLSDPLNTSSDWVKVQISRLTAYKNRAMNVWLRGGWFEIYQLSSAESMKGIQLARTLAQRMVIRKSIFIGKSMGNSEDSSYPGAVTPTELGQIIGIVLHDGPTHFDSCWFNGFDTNGSYIAGAIGFAPKKKFHTSVASSVTNMKFGFTDGVGGNRVFDGLIDDSVQGIAEFNGDESATVRDIDGSVTRCLYDTNWKGPVQLVKAEANAITERCAYRENWNIVICSDTYGKMHIETAKNLRSDFDNSGQMRRRRYDNVDDISVEDNGKQHASEYMLILGSEEFYYEFQYTNEFPESFRLEALGVDKNLSVVIGICLPEGVTVDDFRLSGSTPDDISFGKNVRDPSFKLVDSFEELVSDHTMGKMYLSDRMLFLRISSKKVRNEHWDRHDTDHCAGDFCPKVNIQMEREMAYTTCFDVSEAQMSNTNVLETIEEHDCALPASERDLDWGAGDTLIAKNGSWGEWSSWSDCCNEEGGGTVARTRYRLCDDPAPLFSGNDCLGDSMETSTCPFPCAVDGTFTNWSAWSDCFCDGLAEGSDGVREAFRECVGTANGGEFCDGYVTKYVPCTRRRRKCDNRTAEAVDGVLSEWSVWTDCVCDGLAEGSRGAMTRSRTCDGTMHAGLFCKASLDTVKPCDAECFPEH